MSLYEYNVLSESQKIETLWLHGDFIDDRPHPSAEKQFMLYSLFNFYVELAFNRVENTIEEMRSFFAVKQLEPYLEKIDISSIVDLKKSEPQRPVEMVYYGENIKIIPVVNSVGMQYIVKFPTREVTIEMVFDENFDLVWKEIPAGATELAKELGLLMEEWYM